jgi:hypothetical protein
VETIADTEAFPLRLTRPHRPLSGYRHSRLGLESTKRRLSTDKRQQIRPVFIDRSFQRDILDRCSGTAGLVFGVLQRGYRKPTGVGERVVVAGRMPEVDASSQRPDPRRETRS